MIATVDPSEAAGTAVLPHPDGGDWLYAVLDGSGALTLSDSASELVATAIPGYMNLPEGDAGDDEALGMRYDFLVELARRTQQSIVDQAVKSGELDLAVPLVVIATDYQPYTDRLAPNGRIVWLDPSTEVTFLRALDSLGIIEFRILT